MYRDILIIDDDIIIHCILRKYFDYEFKLATNGIMALNLLKYHTFDLIIIDCCVPLMDGFSISKKIRQGESGLENMDSFILGMTSNRSVDTESFIKSGMDYCVVKKTITKESFHKQLAIMEYLRRIRYKRKMSEYD